MDSENMNNRIKEIEEKLIENNNKITNIDHEISKKKYNLNSCCNRDWNYHHGSYHPPYFYEFEIVEEGHGLYIIKKKINGVVIINWGNEECSDCCATIEEAKYKTSLRYIEFINKYKSALAKCKEGLSKINQNNQKDDYIQKLEVKNRTKSIQMLESKIKIYEEALNDLDEENIKNEIKDLEKVKNSLKSENDELNKEKNQLYQELMKKKKAEREKEELENIKKERNQLYQELMEMKKAEREKENIKKERNQFYQELMEMKKAERESKESEDIKKERNQLYQEFNLKLEAIIKENKNLRNQLDNSKKRKEDIVCCIIL